MRFQYCPDCGQKLVERPIGDEGNVPYCGRCKKPLFDMFATCIIVLVVNRQGEAALLRQNYISSQYHNLISGYMKPGETAEETARREVKEEIGVEVEELAITGTYWFGKKDMLMVGFIASAQKQDLILSQEVDSAQWVPVEQAIGMVHQRGSVSYALLEEYLNRSAQKEHQPFLANAVF